MHPPFSHRDYGSSSESEDIARTNRTKSRQPFIRSPNVVTDSHSRFLSISRRSSSISSGATSRSESPLPQLYPNQSSSYPSDSDNDQGSPLLFDFVNRDACWREDRRSWSPLTRRRRRKGWRIGRCMRWLVRLPFFPNQPTTIVRFFNLLKFIKHILNLSRFLHSFYFLFLLFLSLCFSFTFSTRTRVLYHGERTVLYRPLPLLSTGPSRPPSLTSFPILLQEWQSHFSHLLILIFCRLLDCSLGCSPSILPSNVECLLDQLGLAIRAAETALTRVMAATVHHVQ
jgi:hypothetical protein